MKKLTSLILATLSTMFLAAGATQAAEKFDTLGKSKQASLSGPHQDGPVPPCIIVDPDMSK